MSESSILAAGLVALVLVYAFTSLGEPKGLVGPIANLALALGMCCLLVFGAGLASF